jgi:hypothetical protein
MTAHRLVPFRMVLQLQAGTMERRGGTFNSEIAKTQSSIDAAKKVLEQK